MVAVPPKPRGISMSYWQPHNSGKGVPGGGGQAGSTEGPCPSPPQALSPPHMSPSSHCLVGLAEGVCCSLTTAPQNPRQATSKPWDSSSGLELFLYLVDLGLLLSF